MYAVIGAGPMGLAAARNLQKYGIDFTGFELHANVGGLWDIDNPHSTMYQSAHLISSKSMTEFREFPMKPSVPPYPNHRQMRDYFRDFARHFRLYDDYEFNTRVLDVEREDDGRWRLTTETGGESRSRVFDGVLIANGTLHHPNMPALPGRFSGRLMHAAEYRAPEDLRGQRVLIVGCGNSGADIAVDAVHHAISVDMSLRRGYYFLPKFIMGRPTDTLGGKLRLPRRLKQWLDSKLIGLIMGKPSDYGLPDPDYRMYESHPVINSLVLHHLGHGDIQARRDIALIEGNRVMFADGEQEEYDTILLATGYKLHYPFIRRDYLNWPEDIAAPRLYLNVFHPEYDNLFMMGMIEAAGLGWQGRYDQAEMVALFIRAAQEDHPAAENVRKIKRREAGQMVDGGYHYLQVDRMAYYVHKETYLNRLAEHRRELLAALPDTPGSQA